jgi:phosphoribosylaminoimidazole-succinocarboxamide synthase
MNTQGLYQSQVENYVCRRGKVRDVYELGETMLIIVTTDRISAFDHVFPNITIPDKGRVLNKLSMFWSEALDFKYHLISTEANHLPEEFRRPEFEGRTMLVEKAEVLPFECVVRGYLAGSAWKEYQNTGVVCGITFPPGLKENQQFPKPIFTPAIKNQTGHDENVSFEYMAKELGIELSAEIEALSIELYMDAAQIAWLNGIIIADTKFEWGTLPHLQNELILVDEVFTPDSSRFWPLADYKIGGSINSFDKQYIRDWAEQSGWDKESDPPPLPEDVIEKTRDKYIEAYERLTSTKFVV